MVVNITAPNPTGRRYSSQPVPFGGYTNNYIGYEGEKVLSADLRLPNNNSSGQTVCLCSSTGIPNGRCRSCWYSIKLGATRIPDFVSEWFIADSKNTSNLYPERGQLEDMGTAALAKARPLYVFVRINTVVDSNLEQQIQSTGGGVIRYFRNQADYQDEWDRLGQISIVVGSVVLMIVIALKALPYVRITVKMPRSADRKAQDTMDSAEDLMRQARESAQPTLDRDPPPPKV